MTYTEKRLSIEEIERAYPEAYKWAREFHDLYEETAPMFGYETRKETKEFDPTSPNGRLMAYVCFNLIQQAIAEERERMRGMKKEIPPYPSITRDELLIRTAYNQALDDIKPIISNILK